MHRIAEELPVERRIVIPFTLLRELAAHEQQLLARMREHEREVGTQVGEALPAVARHLPEQRTLAVHDLVLGQRQHEVLAERIVHSEGNRKSVVSGKSVSVRVELGGRRLLKKKKQLQPNNETYL